MITEIEAKKIARAVHEYKKDIERDKDLEVERFDDCYILASNQIIREVGWLKWFFTKKGSWENVSKLAEKIYNKKYGKLRERDDLK